MKNFQQFFTGNGNIEMLEDDNVAQYLYHGQNVYMDIDLDVIVDEDVAIGVICLEGNMGFGYYYCDNGNEFCKSFVVAIDAGSGKWYNYTCECQMSHMDDSEVLEIVDNIEYKPLFDMIKEHLIDKGRFHPKEFNLFKGK